MSEIICDEIVFKKPTSASLCEPSTSMLSLVSNNTNNLSKLTNNNENKANVAKTYDTSVFDLIPYEIPFWSDVPKSQYSLEVMKNGVIVECIDLTKQPAYLFGRSLNCNVVLAHPSISRFHAILVYKNKETNDGMSCGYYLYDTGSVHGTFLNKCFVHSKAYHRIKVGYMIKFGLSSRTYLLNGPNEDQDEESDLTLTQMQLQKEKELREMEEKQKTIEEMGIDWGMGEDADESTDLSVNPYASSNNEDLYKDDPKKVLRNFMEREGFNLYYDCTETPIGHYLCRVELPIDDTFGKSIFAEVHAKGKKENVIVQCAMEACRLLDMHGVLKQSNQESKNVKRKNWEKDDYYDSDDDTYLDRTGSIEEKRQKRMKNSNNIDTYETLMEKQKNVIEEINTIKNRLSISRSPDKNDSQKKLDSNDSLDEFMNQIDSVNIIDKITKSQLKQRLNELEETNRNLSKLIEITSPLKIDPIIKETNSDSKIESNKTQMISTNKKALPLIGKRLKSKIIKPL